MKILDLDMDYFMTTAAAFIGESVEDRLDEEFYGEHVWKEDEVREFLEKHLGLSKEHKIPGRIVVHHNEALFFWQELINKGELTVPFEVIHVDSHADLGLGCFSYGYICNYLLTLPVEERPNNSNYQNPINGEILDVSMADYLLYAIAYRWIEKLTYCGNPNEQCNDYIWYTLKNMQEYPIWNTPVRTAIQLLHNLEDHMPFGSEDERGIARYIENSQKEPEVPFLIIPTIEDVQYEGDFDFAVLAQSPNYTPASADFIMDIFREYIIEI